jgi:hypothetical protein
MHRLIEFLRSFGLSDGATFAEALALLATLSPADQAAGRAMLAEPITLSQPRALAAAGVTVNRQTRVIANVAVMSIGEALGHGFELDRESLDTLVASFEANADRVRSRLSHPEMSIFGGRDSAEVTVGRPKNLRIDGDVVRGDMHLGAFAAKSPAGDLLDFLLSIAEEDPGLIGISIVGAFDFERRFDGEGRELTPVGRVRFLHAVDFVGDPAANRHGLLSSTHSPRRGEGLEADAMNEQLRAFLESKGLKKGATDAQAWALFHKLTGADRASAESLKTGEAPAAHEEDDDEAPADAAGNGHLSAGGAPAPQPQPQPAPAAATVDLDHRIQAALRADRQRRATLSQIAATVGLTAAWVDQHFEACTTPDRARELAMEHLRTQEAPIAGISGHVRVTGDNNIETLAVAVEDAIMLRAGQAIPETDADGLVVLDANGRPKIRRAHERARQFRGLSMPELIRGHLGQLGVPVTGMDRPTLVRLAMSRNELARYLPGVMLSHSTSDFPNVLANVANKTLRRAYAEAPRQWPRFCRRVTNPDFKTITRVQIGNFPNIRKVHEGGEIQQVSVGDAKENYFLAVFAEIFGITWQALVNDDTDAFTRIPASQGLAAGRKEDILTFGVLNANPTMADGVALFHADHGNLITGGDAGAPSVAALNKVAELMALQEGLTTDADEPIYLDLEPDFLLAPRALQGTVLELLTSVTKPGANEGHTANIWQGRLEPILSARLDANSSTAWYGAADPNRQPIDTIEICFLEGNEQPMVTQEDGFNVLERRFRVVHVCEAKAIDHRGLVKNDG